MKTFEQLLEENYHELRDPECRMMLIDFLDCNDVLDSDDIIFVKRLTKVITHLLEEDDSPISVLEKACSFHLQGLELVRKEREAGNCDMRMLKMESHLYSHYAECAMRMFKATKDAVWGERSYLNCLKSAELSAGFEAINEAHSLMRAGEVAHHMLCATKDMGWADKSYDARMKAIGRFMALDPKISLDFVVIMYASLSNLGMHAFSRTSERRWADVAYDYRILCTDLGEQHNSLSAYIDCDTAATYSFRIYKDMGDPEFLEKSYEAKMRSARLSGMIDERHSAHAYSYAGHYAAEMFELTGVPEWADKAISCYNRWLKHYAKNPDFWMKRIEDKMKENIFLLKQAKHSTDAWLEYYCPDMS